MASRFLPVGRRGKRGRSSDARACSRGPRAVLRAGRSHDHARSIDDLYCFYQFDRWTVGAFAERWRGQGEGIPRAARTAEAAARRRLQHLQRLGLISCLAGQSLCAQRDDLAGRPGDLFFLAPLGARVLTLHLGLAPGALKAPELALDRGRSVPGGLIKHRRARRLTWNAHLLACQRLAVRHRWLDDAAWRFIRRLPFMFTVADRGSTLIPDAWVWRGDTLFAVEVEGTQQREHIREKHAKYAALAAALGTVGKEVQLTMVFASVAFRRRTLAYHEQTYARNDGDYDFGWIDYEVALAAAPGTFWRDRRLWSGMRYASGYGPSLSTKQKSSSDGSRMARRSRAGDVVIVRGERA